jgi:predicted nucleic acid-binding protein
VIVADTGAMVALFDRNDRDHAAVKRVFDEHARHWIVPAVILPEVDYLVAKYLGSRAREIFLEDLAEGGFAIDWGRDADLVVAQQISRRYRALELGLVDALVIATAERLKATAIVTLDVRHFAAVSIKGHPKLLPRDAAARP